MMSVWNRQASIGFLFLTFSRIISMFSSRTPNMWKRSKVRKRIRKIPSGSVIFLSMTLSAFLLFPVRKFVLYGKLLVIALNLSVCAPPSAIAFRIPWLFPTWPWLRLSAIPLEKRPRLSCMRFFPILVRPTMKTVFASSFIVPVKTKIWLLNRSRTVEWNRIKSSKWPLASLI